MQEGRNEDAIDLASRCFARAHAAFFENPSLDIVFKWENDWKYMLFEFWGEVLGNFYVDDHQCYLAKHLWETIIKDLKLVNWGVLDKLAAEQDIWRKKLFSTRVAR